MRSTAVSVPTQSTAPTEYPEKIDGAVLKIAGVVVLGAIMSILDITVVNVALNTLAAEFETTLTTMQKQELPAAKKSPSRAKKTAESRSVR